MTDNALPASQDRMPVDLRDKRAGPILEPGEVIAASLNSVPFKWWRDHKNEPPLSETSQPVIAVRDGLRLAGWKIVPMEREDYERS